MARVKATNFEDRLTIVEHLDELRSRLIFSGIVLVLAMVVCFIFNNQLLDIANGPLPGGFEPLTFSPTEPFLTTLTLVLYTAILISLPILLYQIYSFILPAFSPHERRTILPMLLMVPVLFIAGVVFAYFAVVPAAIKFLLNFNDEQFNIQIRAREYYSFFSLALMSVGVLFQIPIGILAVTRLGIVSPQTLAKNRRYAYLIIAVLAMLLPGTDPITMLISMVPLVFLFEFSLILARALGKPGEEEMPVTGEALVRSDGGDDEGDDDEDGEDGPDDDGPEPPDDAAGAAESEDAVPEADANEEPEDPPGFTRAPADIDPENPKS